MYESFFGLKEKPFSLLPDANFLFLSKRHRRVANLLEYGTLNQSGFLVITGEVGAGKTTVIRHYLKHLGPELTVGLLTNASPGLNNLASWIAATFELKVDEHDHIKNYNVFIEFLLAQYAKGKRTLLIVDEAQNLSLEALEELRMLSNVNNERDQLLQIVLVGQPELLENLKRPNLRQLVQRISAHCHLTPLNAFETAAYIRHRLKTAGGDPFIFDDYACAATHYFSYGVPRLINLLADQSMMYAFGEDRKRVDFRTVIEVVTDRNSTGLSAFREIRSGTTDKDLLKIFMDLLGEIRNQPVLKQAS